MAQVSFNNGLPPEEKYTGIENRNFLSPVGFRFIIEKMRGVDFFCQAANVPAMNLGSADQFTRFNKVPTPGDEMQYEDLKIRFLIDENMKNYYQVADWMRNLATPKSSKEFTYNRGDLENDNPGKSGSDLSKYQNQWTSDCSLFVLSSNYQPVAEFVFRSAWPTGLTTLMFDASSEDINYFTAEISFKYTYFDYYIYEAAQATDASMEPDYRRSQEGVILPVG